MGHLAITYQFPYFDSWCLLAQDTPEWLFYQNLPSDRPYWLQRLLLDPKVPKKAFTLALNFCP